jgi:hypothetical protein
MPILKFLCHDCGLTQRKRVNRSVDSIDCSCGSQAHTEAGPSLSVGFNAKIEKSMQVQATGAESLDLDFDRVIGEDSRQKWEVIGERRRTKVDLLHKNQGSNGADLMRLPDGTYEYKPEASKAYREKREDNMNKLRTQKKEL